MTDRRRLRHGRGTRVFLTLFFLVHFGAVLAYVGPEEPDSLRRFPEPLRTPLQAVLPPVVQALLPAARPYLDLTGARQHWTLFAPDPTEWSASVEVVAYYPLDGPGGTAAGGSGPEAWRADTVRLQGPREVPYPHLLDHRSFRIIYNLGYEGWGAFYRPILARRLCDTLRDGTGTSPGGVALFAIWEHTWVWWRDPAEEPGLYRQALGGYDCRELRRGGAERAGVAGGEEGRPGQGDRGPRGREVEP